MEPNTTLAAFNTLLATVKAVHAAWKLFGGTSETSAALFPSSADEFRFVRNLQKSNRRHFADLAYRLPRHSTGRANFQRAPLLCQDTWIPKEPIRLAEPDERLRDDTGQLVTTVPRTHATEAMNSVKQNPDFATRAIRLLPAGQNGTKYQSLHEAILHIEKSREDLFVSRPSYALSKIVSGRRMKLNFSPAHYFVYIDCGELIAYETIYSRRSVSKAQVKARWKASFCKCWI